MTSEVPAASPWEVGRSARGLRGHLDIICAADAAGRSHLRHQSFCAPIHLSKPHLEEETLVVNVVNPTAGLLAGDRIASRVAVERGARLLLTTPSASRAHRTGDGYAEVTQELHVAAGGWLENWPELLIVQGGARYRQRTTIRVETGGELLFFESLAPGRVAMGEVFEFAELQWEMDLVHGGEWVARERYRLTPDAESVRAWRAQFVTGYYASCFVVSPRLAPGFRVLVAHSRAARSGRLDRLRRTPRRGGVGGEGDRRQQRPAAAPTRGHPHRALRRAG